MPLGEDEMIYFEKKLTKSYVDNDDFVSVILQTYFN